MKGKDAVERPGSPESREEHLSGGHVTGPIRIGGTVRRKTGPWSAAVHLFLGHLGAERFEGTPRFLGIDERGREVLEFIEGDVPSALEPRFFGTEQVVFEVGRLIRRLHDAASSFRPPSDSVWRYRVGGPEEGEIVCHGDVVPWNMVLREGKPVALIDWDMAGPDRPISEVAYAAVHFAPLHDDERCRSMGWDKSPDRGRRLLSLCEGYGLAPPERRVLLDECVNRMEKVHEGIKAGALAGDPAMRKLWDEGVADLPLRDIAFIERHRDSLDSLMRD